MIGFRWKFLAASACCLAGIAAIPAFAQEAAHATKADAPLVVDGVVRQVFRSVKQGQTDYLLQIDVMRSEGRTALPRLAHVQFPGPGESVYVHVSQRQGQGAKLLPDASQITLPVELAKIRAYLWPREQGGWEGASPDWFEAISDREVESAPVAPGASSLGITTEPLKIENRLALRVTSVERTGAAQKAGLEEGDVIIGAEGVALPNAERLDELARKGDPFSLIVIDVNTGRGAQIEVTPQAQQAAESTATADQPPQVSLGLSADVVRLGTRSALKVTSVEPNSAAAKVGIEVGDVVVAANGVPTTGPEQLVSALRKSGPVLKLTVRDSRTGKDVDVDVALPGVKAEKPLPADADFSPAASNGQLGAVTELTFHNAEYAIKVTEVEPSSPAARAGLRPGTLILEANGKQVLHPNELNDAVRQSDGTLTLTLFDPLTGKKANVEVRLGK